jgi:GNAT superfamily N-acetyltransferase
LRHGTVWTTEDRQATAIWKPPEKWKLGGVELLKQAPATLAVLGTEPDGQGKGKGSAVLAPVLAQCDRDGEGAYLESSKERNVPFYERHGFRVTEELTVKDGPTLWLMWRDPQPS